MNNGGTMEATKCGPFRSRTEAIEAAKADRHCITLEAFTLIKSRSNGSYDYVHGTANILTSDDIPQADYWRTMRGKWAHTIRRTA